jgi:hypothetical protein
MLPAFAWEFDRLRAAADADVPAAIAFVTVFPTIAAFMFWARGVDGGATGQACSCT